VKSAELYEQIVAQLQGKSCTAPELAKRFGVTRSEINSCLYAGKGTDFIVDGTRPPKWSVVRKQGTKSSERTSLLERRLEGRVHVDFQGGDWTLEIQMSPMSRNDPIALVERMGERNRLIVISNSVISLREKEFQESMTGLPDSAIATAAAVLAWEIYNEISDEDRRVFDFSKAVADILLSVSAQARTA